MDLSLSQDIFGSLGGQRHSGQIRLDIVNFGNLLNSNWGVSQRIVQNQILTNASADANGRATYRMAVVNGALPTSCVSADDGHCRRLHADDQLPLQLQLSRGAGRRTE